MRSTGRSREAIAIVRKALELGVTYFDTARAYADCESYLGRAFGADRRQIFIASKTAQRRRDGALRDLHVSLRELRRDWLDLWQLHDLRTPYQLAEICGPGGALEALEEARTSGKIRFTGITAHKNPEVLQQALRLYPFETVMFPVNILEAHLSGFLDHTLAAACGREMGIIGIFVMAQRRLPEIGIPPELLIRWALTQPVSALSISCDSLQQVEENVCSVRKGPLRLEDAAAVANLIAGYAEELAFYRRND
jgi:aryl-alcohol dehydrogenase-like predicted oxidoreductase